MSFNFDGGTDNGGRKSLVNAVASKGAMKCRLARVLAVVVVLSTATLSLLWSHSKLMSVDDMYEFQTDSVRSLGELVQVQRTWPISLDPPLNHALSHVAMTAFGAGEFESRLPALLGFLLMQVCLFFFVRNLAGERAGVVAAAYPVLTTALNFSVKVRPYGLMLGLYALALWCWQVASRQAAHMQRIWALVGLSAAIASTINVHYYGILLLVPICAAEGFRSLQQRRIDWPMCAAICVGMAGFAATWPFLQALNVFRKNYFNLGMVSLKDITWAYQSIFVDYSWLRMSVPHLHGVVLVAFAAAIVWGCARVMRGGLGLRIPAAEWVLVLTLAALPFYGYLLARFVTHSVEMRSVLGTVVAISAMLAVAISPWLGRDRVFAAVMVVLGVAIIGTCAARIHAEQRKTADALASLVLPEKVKAALIANPDGRLYIQNLAPFEQDHYYETDPDVRTRMTIVYSQAEELRWNRHDTMALTAMHMAHFTGLPVVSYEELKTKQGEHMFVLYNTAWDWTDEAFSEDGARVRLVGRAMGGDVVTVEF